MNVGQRVAEARSESGLTQAQLASAVGVERSVLAKMETGARRVSAVELVAIGRTLGRRIEWFVDPGPPAVASYRANRETETQAIDRRLDEVVRNVEFVAALVPNLLTGLPKQEPVPTSNKQAEALADRARGLLGLEPDEPAHNLAARLQTIGLFAFSLPLGAGADGGTVLLEQGGVSIVNGDVLTGRRRLALAHEFGHYLIADPYTTDWRVAVDHEAGLESRLDRFARALLLPPTDLTTRWEQWTSLPEETLRDAAVRAGSHYRVDMATLAYRLRELEVVSGGEERLIRDVRTKKADIVEKDLHIANELDATTVPVKYEAAVLKLYRSEDITAERAIDLLLDTYDADALPDLPPGQEQEIWAVTS